MSRTGLIAWLSARWRERGGHPALVDGARTIDYATLEDRVLRAAAALDACAAGRRGAVALIAGNSAEYVFAALGGVAAGRVVAEISRKETTERLLAVLARLAPAVVVTDLPAERFSGIGAAVLDVAAFARLLEGAPLPPAPAPARADDEPAFVVFTSGTTGLPKGVMLGEPGLIAVTEAILERLPIGPDERYALVLPFNHTYGKSVLLTTLRVGGTVVLDEGFADLPGFVARLAARRITAFAGVPYHAQLLRTRAPLREHDLSCLRTFTISGGPMPPGALDDLAAKLPATSIFFMYGLTESSTRATILPPAQRRAKPGSCGTALSCVRVRIAGDDGAELPRGAAGEVLLAGSSMMLGYWNEPDLSAATLRDGWLHTGDVGRLDDEGFLYLEGRRNDLIKSAGERISAVEIEEALADHPAVAEVAVQAVPNEVLGEAVGAWVVRRDPALTQDELIAHCARRLVPYKIPRAWFFLDELPRTASGKVQKHRLTDNSLCSR